MSRELHDLLDRALPEGLESPDFDALARRGIRRRRGKRVAVVAVGLAVVVGVGAAMQLPEQGRLPQIDRVPGSQPAWEEVDQGPLSPRLHASVAVDGTRAVIWGGEGDPPAGPAIAPNGDEYAEVVLPDGAVWDAAARTWTHVPAPPMAMRSDPIVRLSGDALLVWGGGELVPAGGGGIWLGGRTAILTDGAVYDLASARWEMIPPAPLEPRVNAVIDWDGEELLVWGGRDQDDHGLVDGATWRRNRGWVPMESAPLGARVGPLTAVDDARLVVWGGLVMRGATQEARSDGALYDRGGGTWTLLPPAPLDGRWFTEEWPGGPNARIDEGVVLVAGGAHGSDVSTRQSLDGAQLDLTTLTWTRLPDAPDSARFATVHPSGTFAVDDGPSGRVWIHDRSRSAWVEVRAVPEHSQGMDWQVLDAGPFPVVAHSWYDTGRDPLSWHPVTVVIDGEPHTPPIPEQWPLRHFAAFARVDGGVLVWGGQSAVRDGGSSGYSSDGTPAGGGWFLPTE